MDDMTERAATVPGWPAGPDLVHAVFRGLMPDTWITACPAGGEGLPDGEHRKVVFSRDRIDCTPCRQAMPDVVELVDGVNAAIRRRQHAAATEVAAFLRWLAEERQIVLADYAGGVTLKSYPTHLHDGLIQQWLAGRDDDE